MTAKTEQLATIFKVLGDPNRLNIVMCIGRGSRSVTEIINATGLSQTLVSFHLKALRNASIVNTERNGPFIYYSLTEPSLMDILDDLAQAASSIELIGSKVQIAANGRGFDKRRRWSTMLWNGPGPGWGPMYGWWFMPIYGILFLLIVVFIVGRFFGGKDGFCRRPPADRDSGIDELRKEIKALRDEVRELKNRTILKWWLPGGGMMDKDKIGDLFSKMSPASKKELLNDLVASLLKDVSPTDKKQVLQSILAGGQGSGQVIDMVERWIQECTDSGVNPVEMSKEVISAISHSYELATYSTPELRGLFNDWLGEIEREVLEYLSDRNRADPDEVAGHFKLERESAIFILSKLAREGKINIQASGSE